MIIGIDANEANVLSRVGSNQYAFEILSNIEKLDHFNQFIIYLRDDPVADLPKARKNWKYEVFGPKPLWTQWRLPLKLALEKNRPNVFYSLGHYAPRFSPMPTVINIMDLAFLRFPQLFLKKDVIQLTSWTNYSVKNAHHIITISQNSAKDIANYYDFPLDRITIAYPGFDLKKFKKPTPKDIDIVKTKYNINGKYILYLGTLQPRKNLVRLLKAFETLPSKFDDTILVIAGKKGWLYQEFVDHLNKSAKKHKIRLTGFVDFADISALYSGAECFTLVGLYEGFGIPPLEALSYNTIPIVSNTASLPEVVGGGGILVDPYSITSIRKGLEKALKLSQVEKIKKIKKSQKHISKFSWQTSAKKILEVLYEIAA